MFKCEKCSFQSVQNSIYISHIINFHSYPGYVPKFVCPLDGCNRRSYCNLKSFRSHLKSHDRAKNETNTNLVETVLTKDLEKENMFGSESFNDIQSTLQLSEPAISDSSKTISASNILDKFKSSFHELSLTLYADESLPRKKVTDILGSCQSAYQSLFTDIRSYNSSERKINYDDLFKELSETSFVDSELILIKNLQKNNQLVPIINYVLSDTTTETQNTEAVQIKKSSTFF